MDYDGYEPDPLPCKEEPDCFVCSDSGWVPIVGTRWSSGETNCAACNPTPQQHERGIDLAWATRPMVALAAPANGTFDTEPPF